MNNILFWYFINFYEAILIPIVIFYFIFYLLFHTIFPLIILESLLADFISFSFLTETLEFIFFIFLGLFLFSVFILRPFTALPRTIVRQNLHLERFLYFIGTICLVFLLVEQKGLKDQLHHVEKTSLIQKDMITNFEKLLNERETNNIVLTQQAEIIEQLKAQLDVLTSTLATSHQKFIVLEDQIQERDMKSRQDMEDFSQRISQEANAKFQTLTESITASSALLQQFQGKLEKLEESIQVKAADLEQVAVIPPSTEVHEVISEPVIEEEEVIENKDITEESNILHDNFSEDEL